MCIRDRIKGVHNAPTQASLSLKKASVTPVGSLVENKEKSLQATNSHITVLLDEAVEALAVKPDGVYAVSYTHLDVYKRQLITCHIASIH